MPSKTYSNSLGIRGGVVKPVERDHNNEDLLRKPFTNPICSTRDHTTIIKALYNPGS
jgi:hypothetical protein